MGIYGTGIITNLVMSASDEDWYPAYRWDKPSSPYYHLRPDRLIRNFHYFTDPSVRLRYDLEKLQREISSRGVGGPSASPTSTAPSVTTPKRLPESRKAAKTQSAHGFRKTKGVSARGKCPKGHYWSYKKKKCVKSKFR